MSFQKMFSQNRALKVIGVCAVVVAAVVITLSFVLNKHYTEAPVQTYGLLTISISYTDYNSTLTEADWTQLTFNGAQPSFSSIYSNASYGRVQWKPELSHYVSVQMGRPVEARRCNINALAQDAIEARSLALRQGVDSGHYDLVEHVFPHLGCGMSGWAYTCVSSIGEKLGTSRICTSFIQGELNLHTRVHETGHTFGLGHAAGGGYEYGDPTSVMGGSRMYGWSLVDDFDAAARVQLRWVATSAVRSISTLSPTAVERVTLSLGHGGEGGAFSVGTIDCVGCHSRPLLRGDATHEPPQWTGGGTVVVAYRPSVLPNVSLAATVSMGAGITVQLIKGWRDSHNSTIDDGSRASKQAGTELYAVVGEGEHVYLGPGLPAVHVCALSPTRATVALTRDGQLPDHTGSLCSPPNAVSRRCDCGHLVARLGPYALEFRMASGGSPSQPPVYRQYHGAALQWEAELLAWRSVGAWAYFNSSVSYFMLHSKHANASAHGACPADVAGWEYRRLWTREEGGEWMDATVFCADRYSASDVSWQVVLGLAFLGFLCFVALFHGVRIARNLLQKHTLRELLRLQTASRDMHTLSANEPGTSVRPISAAAIQDNSGFTNLAYEAKLARARAHGPLGRSSPPQMTPQDGNGGMG